MSQEKIDILLRAVERQKGARKAAEKILEEKSLELYNISKELKRANDQLENLLSEKTIQLKGIFQNINDAYIVIDINGNVLKINDNAIGLFGYQNIKNLNATNLIYQEDLTYARQSFRELLNKGSFSNFSSRIVTKTNQIKWVQINASVVYDENNKAIAVQGIIRDVTVQREKRLIIDMTIDIVKSILGKEDIYEIAWEITNSIVNYLATNDCVIYLVDYETNTLEQIAAYKNKASSDKKIINKIRIPIGEGIVGYVAQTGKSEIIKNTSKDKRYIIDDDIRLSEITVPIISEGKVIAVIDSEHKEKNYFTKEQKVTIENMANLVAIQLKSAINIRERNRVEIKNTELLKKLEKSNEELKEYAHIVSHDLKSPLRSLAALTYWIKTDNLEKFDQASLQNFEDIDITLKTMDNLISDVLKYSRLDTIGNENQEIDFNVLIKDLIHVLYIPKNISINILNKLPTFYGDKTKFQQLFQNLISNAIKFNNKEKGIINIDVEDHKTFYKFSVKDNGIGIQKKHFNKIFKIFQSLKKSKKSSGIGLSIVKKIVDIYKGEVWLESEINKETTFYFTIKK
ncbi:ATP-binding protein [uncultured Polaribacter sp.]|uniref:ATP-binding protein n=1 Tax=uncultured Polaribacter sp. TaxID=174711 RepID=UPI00262286B1|nr:ATP-binding protein [uncultured Polaribacter sp.]